MVRTAALLVATLLGAEARREIEVGWQPLPDGGMQYLIQIDPQMVEILRAGFAAESDIHPQVKDVRSFRISIGTGPLPRQEPRRSSNSPAPTGTAWPPSLGTSGPGKTNPPNATSGSSSEPGGANPGAFTRPQGPSGDKPAWSLPGGRSASSPGEAPAKLPANLDSRPVPDKRAETPPVGKANRATFEQTVGEKRDETADSSSTAKRPWTALTAALAGLFGSLGGNVYLGWLFLETRRRYRALLKRGSHHLDRDWDAPPENPDEALGPSDE
ncbi:MAG: hypothetical protein NUV77_08100 [Thermoguttaceae bacterium]|jgi:hypothetical protein|nr:hypothetical protein [Thermoguttaceae bacterium]